MIRGLIDYDPRHRVPRKKELAIKKTHLQAMCEVLQESHIDPELAFTKLQAAQSTEALNLVNHIKIQFCKTKIEPYTAIVRIKEAAVSEYRSTLRSMGIIVLIPAWGPHITWIRGEKPLYLHNWLLHQDEEIEIKLESELKESNLYYFFDVSSPILDQYRSELGLNPRYKVPLHLTLGKRVINSK